MLKAISHIIISILVLFLSIGITVSKHYSNGKLYSQSVFGEAESCESAESEVCEMQNTAMQCEMHNEQNENNNTEQSCSCEDTSEYLYFDAIYTVAEKLTLNPIYKNSTVFFTSNIIEISSIETNRNTQFQFSNRKMPGLKTQDFASLFQIFRC
ncbi:MAG: hypothetical protein L3J35_01320 [Bacteroidales bacterium]|nr:hypothetical protein [Bacteroidales bacterium]